MSSVQLCDGSYMNKHELPIQRPPAEFVTPVLSLVGDKDFVVDIPAADETAQHFGEAKAVHLKDMAHDLMLVSIPLALPRISMRCMMTCVSMILIRHQASRPFCTRSQHPQTKAMSL